MIDNFITRMWDKTSGCKTILTGLFMIGYGGEGIFLKTSTPEASMGFISAGLLAIGMRSAIATTASKMAVMIAESLAQKISDKQTETTATNSKEVVRQILTNALNSLLENNDVIPPTTK